MNIEYFFFGAGLALWVLGILHLYNSMGKTIEIIEQSMNSIERDKRLLSVCETLSDEVKNLQDRISLLENK